MFIEASFFVGSVLHKRSGNHPGRGLRGYDGRALVVGIVDNKIIHDLHALLVHDHILAKAVAALGMSAQN